MRLHAITIQACLFSLFAEFAFAANVQIDLAPSQVYGKWCNQVSPTFLVSTESFPAGNPFTNELLAAVKQWNDGPANFKFLTKFQSNVDPNGEENIIQITDDQNYLSGSPGVAWLDHSDSTENGTPCLTRVRVFFDVALTTTDSNKSSPRQLADFRSVVLHELGHALGLTHFTNYGLGLMGIQWDIITGSSPNIHTALSYESEARSTYLYGEKKSGSRDLTVLGSQFSSKVEGNPGQYYADGSPTLLYDCESEKPTPLKTDHDFVGNPFIAKPGQKLCVDLSVDTYGIAVSAMSITYTRDASSPKKSPSEFPIPATGAVSVQAGFRYKNASVLGSFATFRVPIQLPTELVPGENGQLVIKVTEATDLDKDSYSADNSLTYQLRIAYDKPQLQYSLWSPVQSLNSNFALASSTGNQSIVLPANTPMQGIMTLSEASLRDTIAVKPDYQIQWQPSTAQFTYAQASGGFITPFSQTASLSGQGSLNVEVVHSDPPEPSATLVSSTNSETPVDIVSPEPGLDHQTLSFPIKYLQMPWDKNEKPLPPLLPAKISNKTETESIPTQYIEGVQMAEISITDLIAGGYWQLSNQQLQPPPPLKSTTTEYDKLGWVMNCSNALYFDKTMITNTSIQSPGAKLTVSSNVATSAGMHNIIAQTKCLNTTAETTRKVQTLKAPCLVNSEIPAPKVLEKNSLEGYLRVQAWDPSCVSGLTFPFEATIAKCEGNQTKVLKNIQGMCQTPWIRDLQFRAVCSVPLTSKNFVSKWSVSAKNSAGKTSAQTIETTSSTLCAQQLLKTVNSKAFMSSVEPINTQNAVFSDQKFIQPMTSTGAGVTDPLFNQGQIQTNQGDPNQIPPH